MGKIANVSAREAVKAFGRAGFQVVTQTGSHIKMRRMSLGRVQTIIVPDHKRLKTGTLVKGILRPIGMTTKEFLDLL